jgi:hypothetical protein
MSQDNINKTAVFASIQALFNCFEPAFAETYVREVAGIIEDEPEDFMFRTKLLEQWVAKHPTCQDLEDVLFDLLLVHFLAAELHEENYFDSAEWNEIEQKTLDKGSEMLNLFLYLGEAKETEAEVSLEDFLNEFLLVGEDEFQDEYRIYESLIVNEHLLEADLGSLRLLKDKVKEDTGLKDFFIPIVLFFQNLEDPAEEANLAIGLNAFEVAIYYSLIAYSKI